MAGDSVIVILDGAPFDGWKKVEITQTFDKASGEGSLTISPLPGVPLPADVGSSVAVILSGEPVLTGYVRKCSSTHDYKSHDINLSLKDKTQDFVDSTVGPKLEFKPEVKLKDVLRGTLNHMGLSDIGVADKVNPDPYRKGGEVPVADVDDTGHGFADKWAGKRQVVLNTDGKGNLVIDRNQKRRFKGHLTKRFEDSAQNNVLVAQYENSDETRHNGTSVAGQKSTNDKDHWESRPKSDEPAQANPLSKNWGTAYDDTVRPQLRRHVRGMIGIEGKTPEDSAKWLSNLARARNYTYRGTVQGFRSAAGQLWWPGFIVPVVDEHYQISDELFIKEVVFSKDYGGGAKTVVTCTVKDAYSETGASEGGGRTAKSGLASPKGGKGRSDMGVET